MIIKAIDYFYKKELTGKVNIFKKEIQIVKNGKKSGIYSYLPFKYATYRVFEFPFSDNAKISKAVTTSLQMEIKDITPFSFDFFSQNGKVFCIIAKKETVEKIKEDTSDLELLDSDLFCLLRLMLFNNITSGEIYHFYEDFALYMKVSDSFPIDVRSYPLDKVQINGKAYLSGKIPSGIKGKILNNPSNNPELNILFGLLIRPFFKEGIDFLHKGSKKGIDSLTKLVVGMLIALFFVNGGILVQKYFLNKQLQMVKNKEKEIFIKYFGSATVIDPLSQAKGLVSQFGGDGYTQKDSSEILYQIAVSKKKIPQIKILKMTVENTEFYITGYSDSIEDIDHFKRVLSSYFSSVSVEESKKDASGKVRFSVKGKV